MSFVENIANSEKLSKFLVNAAGSLSCYAFFLSLEKGNINTGCFSFFLVVVVIILDAVLHYEDSHD